MNGEARAKRPALVRRHDWPERLSEVFEAAATRLHQPGVHDCALNVGDVTLALTGVDIAARWRGRYETEAAGMALLAAELGTKSLAAAMRKHLPTVHVAFADRGDIALAMVGGPNADAPTLMVFDDAWLRGPSGAMAPRSAAVRAWKVG